MENKQHHYTGIGVILFIAVLPVLGWTAQPMSDGTLALQTGILNNALPSVIDKAKQDQLKPEEERWRAQKLLSDRNLREIRISTIMTSVLSPHEEQKKSEVDDPRDKKEATIKPRSQASDRYMIYGYESDNVQTYRFAGTRATIQGRTVDTVSLSGN